MNKGRQTLKYIVSDFLSAFAGVDDLICCDTMRLESIGIYFPRKVFAGSLHVLQGGCLSIWLDFFICCRAITDWVPVNRG